MEASSPSGDRIDVGRVISETFSTYGQHFLVLFLSALAVFVVFGTVAGILESSDSFILSLLGSAVRLVGQAIYVGFVVKLVEDVRDGRRDQSVGDLFSAAAPSIGPLIGFGILWAIGVTIGLILLIIPGLILITIWAVGGPAIVAERVGVIEAFGRSRELVRGEGWSVFATLLVMLLIVVVIGVILGIIATPISDGATVVASIISSALTAPLFALAVTIMFFDLGGRSSEAAATAPQAPAA